MSKQISEFDPANVNFTGGETLVLTQSGVTYSTQLSNIKNWIDIGESIIFGLSATWNTTHTTVDANSANWNSSYAIVDALSADWESTYQIVDALSSNWESTYGLVDALSADWESTYGLVDALSVDWNSAYATVDALSSNWESAYNTVQNTSSNFVPYTGASAGLDLNSQSLTANTVNVDSFVINSDPNNVLYLGTESNPVSVIPGEALTNSVSGLKVVINGAVLTIPII